MDLNAVQTKNKLTTVFSLLVAFIGLFFSVIIFTGNLNIADKMFITRFGETPVSFVLIIGVSLIVGIILLSFKFIDNCSNRSLFIFGIALISVLLLGQIVILSGLNVVMTTDAYMVQDQALALAKGIDRQIDTVYSPYFQSYSNNDFAVLLTAIIDKIAIVLGISVSANAKLLAILNALLIDVGIALICRTAYLLFGKRNAVKVLLLNIANPLNYLLVWWIYTCTYSIPLTIAGIWTAVELLKSKSRIKQLVYAAIFGLVMALGYFLRPTVLISGIAVILCCIFFRNRATLTVCWKQLAAVVLSAILSFAICFSVINLQVSEISGDDTKNFPVTHWIMMGLHHDGQVTYQDMNFTRELGTTDKMKKEHLSEITKSLNNLGIGGVTELAVNKMQKTWSDGTADYNFRLVQAEDFGFMYRWLAGDKRGLVNSYCHCYRTAILLLAIICLAGQCFNTKVNSLCLFTLCLDGAILFYIIWEAKNVYSVPFLPFLFILSFSGADTLNRKISKQTSKLFSLVGTIIIMLTVIVGASYYQEMTKDTFLKTDYSINCANGQIVDYTACYDKVSKENKKIIQTFHTDKAFNNISIASARLDANNECSYKISLLKNNDLVTDIVIDIDSQESGFVKLKVNCPASEKGKGNYKIIIEAVNVGVPDSLAWRYTKAKVIDQYDGMLSIADKVVNEDLYISVKNITEGIYITSALYILFFVALCLLEFVVVVIGNRIYSKKQPY